MKKRNSDHVVFTFGRFNPPTTGHKKLVDKVVSHAWKHKADHYIFASHSQDSEKNPLTHTQKVGFLKKFFPHANVHSGENGEHVKTAIDAAKHLSKKGYKHVTMFVGDDRQQEFHNLLHKYNGKEYHIPHLEVKSAGQRDPDSEGVEGMSASKMRDHAKKKNFSEFKKGVPNQEHAKELYHAVRKGMKLESFEPNFKALFLVGGPGSGKDLILKPLIEESNILEIHLDRILQAISEKSEIEVLLNYPSVIINGNADNFNKIMITKNIMETMGYETSMVFVYTSNEESKTRNDERIARKAKTFTEEVRHEKYVSSVKNMHSFVSLFEHFYIFDNSFDYSSVSSNKKVEILGWLLELGEMINEFFCLPPSSEEAKLWLMENASKKSKVMIVPKPVGGDSSDRKPILKGYKRVWDGSNWKLVKEDGAPGGIGQKGTGDKDEIMAKDYPKPQKGSPYMYPKDDSPKSKKKTGEKAATPPPSFFDSRMGAVPSGGIGLTVSHYELPDGEVIREKSFEKFRKNLTAIINNVDKE